MTEVLDGRRSVRELVRDPAFERELDQAMTAFADQWESLTPEQRAELVREGQRDEAALREQTGCHRGRGAGPRGRLPAAATGRLDETSGHRSSSGRVREQGVGDVDHVDGSHRARRRPAR